MAWTDERIDELKKMWEKGMTASQIAEKLGGVSRNAVIGKAHRLGLKSRPSPVKAKSKAKKKPATKKAAPKAKAATKAKAKPAPQAPAPAAKPAEAPQQKAAPAPSGPQYRSIGPGGFTRQSPADQQPLPPAPPRRLVPQKLDPEYEDKTGLLDLTERICKWPMGHPGESDFHFCGEPVNPGFPYCVEHCGRAYQAQLPRKDRRPPPPLPFGGPRVR
ncbi:MAG: GcrA family cell cycle regulator [Parasphingopyxis sp.]|uniref:GcrA family cell cycle regulator n=1 Tax=Parasphingopyxis sp. TaxID=1920299 RepID=UPI003F9EC19C